MRIDTYNIGALLVDQDYTLSDYTLSADTVIGFDLTNAVNGSCVYVKIIANGISKITFDNTTVESLTGISQNEILSAGKYTLIAVYNGFKADISISKITENLKPLSIPASGLQVFFDLKDASTIVLDGSSITQVNNLAIPNYFLTQTTFGFKPTFNALEGAVFDGVDDYFSSNVPSSLMTTTGDYTVFVVYKSYTPPVASNRLAIYENSSASSGFHVANIQNGVLKQGYYKSTTGYINKSINSAVNARHISFLENIAGVVNLELDNLTASGTSTISTALGLTNGLQVGANGDTKAYFYKGSIEKIIIYNRQLTSVEKADVISYLS